MGGKIFKIWTTRYSKNAFANSHFLLTVLNQLWKFVVFITFPFFWQGLLAIFTK